MRLPARRGVSIVIVKGRPRGEGVPSRGTRMICIKKYSLRPIPGTS